MFKLRAYEFWDKLNLTVIGPFYRSLGKSLYALGARMQGELYSDDRCSLFSYSLLFITKNSGSKFKIGIAQWP